MKTSSRKTATRRPLQGTATGKSQIQPQKVTTKPRPLEKVVASWLVHVLLCATPARRQPKHRANEECLADKIETDGDRQNIILGCKIGSAENPQSAEQTECGR